MTTPKETLERAYGNIPRDVGLAIFDWVPTGRGIKYHWILFKRFFTR